MFLCVKKHRYLRKKTLTEKTFSQHFGATFCFNKIKGNEMWNILN